MPLKGDFDSQVFVNCPFDEDYLSLLRPLLFTVLYLGFVPRIASERLDSGENRIDKICSLIRACRYSIHDLSRLRAQKVGETFRMNMPFELGIDYGLRYFSRGRPKGKRFLILERDRYEFQKGLSDLSGVDIKAHHNKPDDVVRVIRDWFIEVEALKSAPSPKAIWYAFARFASDFYDARKAAGYTDEDLNMMPVPEYAAFIDKWVREDKKA
jgi:hypothetical protein